MSIVVASPTLRTLVVAGAVLASLTGVAAAQQTPSCPKPPMPACIDDLTTFVSADRMVECQSAVKVYIDVTMNYMACRQNMDSATNAELIAAVNRFNCRLMGGENCQQPTDK